MHAYTCKIYCRQEEGNDLDLREFICNLHYELFVMQIAYKAFLPCCYASRTLVAVKSGQVTQPIWRWPENKLPQGTLPCLYHGGKI
jgi:hypothetical protein